MKESGIIGMGALIIIHKQVVWTKAYGFADSCYEKYHGYFRFIPFDLLLLKKYIKTNPIVSDVNRRMKYKFSSGV